MIYSIIHTYWQVYDFIFYINFWGSAGLSSGWLLFFTLMGIWDHIIASCYISWIDRLFSFLLLLDLNAHTCMHMWRGTQGGGEGNVVVFVSWEMVALERRLFTGDVCPVEALNLKLLVRERELLTLVAKFLDSTVNVGASECTNVLVGVGSVILAHGWVIYRSISLGENANNMLSLPASSHTLSSQSM